MKEFDTAGKLIDEAIDALGITNAEFAQRVGFKSPNVVSMIRKGHTKLPVKRVPVVAKELELDPRTLLRAVLLERDPEQWHVLCEIFDFLHADDEDLAMAAEPSSRLGRYRARRLAAGS